MTRVHRHIDNDGNEFSCTSPVNCALTSARFWSKVEVLGADDCWEWLARRSERGYGEFWDGAQNVRAHRWMLEDSLGRPLPPGKFALHMCDNPPCVNPKHLYEGTHSDNLLDRIERGGGHVNAHKTHCIHGHPFTPENTRHNADGHRECRTCAARRKREYKQRQRSLA